MRVLVTGGAGFIGGHIAEAAIAAGHEVLVLDDLSTGLSRNVPREARFEQADLRDATAVEHVVATFRPNAVSHQGAQTSVSKSVREAVLDAEVNVLGTLHLLEALAKHPAERFVLASTGGAIYGEVPPGVLLANETVQVNARVVEGDDGCVRDYVYVEDVVRLNTAALEGRVTEPMLNVCRGEETSTRNLAELLKRLAESSADLRFGPPRAGDLERSVLEPPREEALRARVTLEDGLARTVDWFRADAAYNTASARPPR